MLDSLRFDHVGCCGNKWIETPNIDRLAEEGTLFECAYVDSPHTLPARTSLFTGRYTFPFRGWKDLEPTDILLSEVLMRNGYTTALISDTSPMFRSYGRGFDYVHWLRSQFYGPERLSLDEMFTAGSSDVEKLVEKYIGNYYGGGLYTEDRERILSGRAGLESYFRDRTRWKGDEDSCIARVVKAGIKWLESQEQKDNLFLWLDIWDPHEPWDPPSPYNRMYVDPEYKGEDIVLPNANVFVEGYLSEEEIRHILALYAGEVTMVDKWVGIFLKTVRELDLLDNSLIILLSDHGEPFGEHGVIRKNMTHLYEELIHIPLIIRHPDGLGKGKRIKSFVNTTDIMPTILDFFGIPESGGARFPPYFAGPLQMHGSSLLPLLSGEKESIREYAYCGYYVRHWVIRHREWKYMMWSPQHRSPMVYDRMGKPVTQSSAMLDKFFEFPKKPELFNLEEDLHEKNNLVDREPEIAESLDRELRRFVDTVQKTQPSQIPTRGERILKIYKF